MSKADTGLRKRLVADRFRRIWQVVQTVADEPGMTRRDLADRFHLSERQVQADLNIVRYDMHLPLVRRQGYRFLSEGPTAGEGSFDLREAQLLVLVLAVSRKDRSVPRDRLDALIAKLPAMFPPHLAPLAQRTLEAVVRPRSAHQGMVFSALGDALLRGSWVKLHYPPHDVTCPVIDPTVRPELLIPYLSSWYVIGHCQQRNRTMMFNLDAVDAVTVSPEIPGTNGRRP